MFLKPKLVFQAEKFRLDCIKCSELRFSNQGGFIQSRPLKNKYFLTTIKLSRN